MKPDAPARHFRQIARVTLGAMAEPDPFQQRQAFEPAQPLPSQRQLSAMPPQQFRYVVPKCYVEPFPAGLLPGKQGHSSSHSSAETKALEKARAASAPIPNSSLTRFLYRLFVRAGVHPLPVQTSMAGGKRTDSRFRLPVATPGANRAALPFPFLLRTVHLFGCWRRSWHYYAAFVTRSSTATVSKGVLFSLDRFEWIEEISVCLVPLRFGSSRLTWTV